MLDLAGVLRQYGLQAEGRLENYDALLKGTYPVIAHVKDNHFVVVETASEEFVMLLDGDGRRTTTTARGFQEQWDGKLLRVTRADPNRPPPDCERGPNTPRVQFDSLFIDKGEIPFQQDAVVYEFRFRNLGGADLAISRIRTDCACLKSEKPDEVIPPGHADKITLTYVANKASAFMHKAFVETNDPCVPVVELVAAGNTARTLIVDPRSFDLGKVILGESKTVSCVVRYLGDTPLAIQELTCDVSILRLDQQTITEKQIEQMKARRVFAEGLTPSTKLIQVTWDATGDVGAVVNGKVEFKTNIKGFEQVTVPFKAEVVAPVVLAPSVLYFGEVDSKAQVRQTVTALSRDGHTFQIEAVDLKGSGAHCSYAASSDKNKVELSFSGKGADFLTLSNTTIPVQVETAKGLKYELLLPVYARNRDAPHRAP